MLARRVWDDLLEKAACGLGCEGFDMRLLKVGQEKN